MKKTFTLWCFLLIFICFQMEGFSQTNTSLGAGANPNNAGVQNTAIGNQALNSNISGNRNTAIGDISLLNNSTGSNNTSVGSRALRNNTSGVGNSALGINALLSNTTGLNNLALGSQSLEIKIEGGSNVAVGHRTLFELTNGNQNIALGARSGANLVSGNNNVFIGRVVLPINSDFNNRVIISAGGDNSQRIYINENGYTGIGLGNNVIPQNRLELGTGGVANTAGLRFRMINSGSNTSPSNGKVLSVNENGDVILVPDLVGSGGGVGNSIQAGNNVTVNLDGTTYTINSAFENIYTHDGALTSDRTMDMNDFNLHFSSSNSLDNGRIYIGDTPLYPTDTGDYRLYVEGGVLTEKVKVALRNTANWADYVFADDYKLKPLNEVENFIKEYKHLPGIESAQELVENGLDLGEMQAKQIAKIEELTMYIIEQDKKLEQQSKDIEELKALVKVLMEKK